MKTVHRNSNTQNEMPESEEAFWKSKLKQFDTQFPEEEDCMNELLTIANREDGLRCRHCGSLRVKKIAGGRAIICRDCKNETWWTAGTFFKNIRHARAWLFAIWLMERGWSISRSRFH